MRMLFVAAFVLLHAAAAQANSVSDLGLPVTVSDAEWRPLRDCRDADLERRLTERIRENRQWRYLVDRSRLAVGVVDLSNPTMPRLAQVNGDTMFYAASLPKIAILLAAFIEIEKGELEVTEDMREDIEDMIDDSSNTSATRLIDYLGFKTIEAAVTDPRYKLYDVDHGGGLWVGKRYARSGKRYRDPIRHTTHGATAVQVCRFYYLLATGRLINPERSSEMLDIMSDSDIKHKFVFAYRRIAQDATVFRKSGTWRTWHSDSALVCDGEERRYIIVGLVEDSAGEQILRDLAEIVDGLLIDE
jgi:beta-lactamase class A